MRSSKSMNNGSKGEMSVREAGQKGGRRTSETHGHDFYRDIGQKGGQTVKRLIEEGKRAQGNGNGNGSSMGW